MNCSICDRNFFTEIGFAVHKKNKHPPEEVTLNVKTISDEDKSQQTNLTNRKPENSDFTKKLIEESREKSGKIIKTNPGTNQTFICKTEKDQKIILKTENLKSRADVNQTLLIKTENLKSKSKVDQKLIPKIENLDMPIIANKKKCQLCNVTLCSISSLNRHIVLCHNPHLKKKNPPIQCTLCEKFFKESYILQKHIREVHEKSQPFQCQQCGKRFSQNYFLGRHTAMVHDKLKPFQCHICGNNFSLKFCLQKHHRIVHEKNQPIESKAVEKSQNVDLQSKRTSSTSLENSIILVPKQELCTTMDLKNN